MKENKQEEEFDIAKRNRRKNQEAEKSTQVIHPHLVFYDREKKRKDEEKKTNQFVKKARKKAKG